MKKQEDFYTSLIPSVERIGLLARYIVFAVFVPLFLLGHLQENLTDLLVVAGALTLHNAFVHWVFISGRYDLFVSRINFFLYFLETCVIVAFTGAEQSVAYALYFMLLFGFSAYRREFWRIMLVTFLCCFSYVMIIVVEWLREGLSEPMSVIVSKQMAILLCGWLVANLSDRLRRAEEESYESTQELAASEATLRTILDSTADPIWVFDENEFIVEVNDSACEFFGMPRETLLGQRARKFAFDDGTLPAKMAELRSRGEYRGEQLLVTADGDERTVDVVARSFIRDQKGYCVTLVHDTSAQKALQEATRRANTNLERLNSELRQVDQLRTGFLATISQKLRSPLSAVLGYLEMLLENELGPLSDEQAKALQTCRRGTLRAFRVIDEALDLGRVTQNGKKPDSGPGQSSPDEHFDADE